MFDWPADDTLKLPVLAQTIVSARLPKVAPDATDSVVALELK